MSKAPSTAAGIWLSEAIGDGYCEGWTTTVRDGFIAAVETQAREKEQERIARLMHRPMIVTATDEWIKAVTEDPS